jgi:hypothetical protein
MSSQTRDPARDPVRDPVRELAAKIYVELVCRNVVVTDNAAQIKTNPENLAKISFKLAQVFQRVDVDVKGATAPKNEKFDVQDADLASWDKAKL